MILIDKELSARLERTEGLACASFIEARGHSASNTDATWIEVAGALVMYDGPESPLTQSFGLGMQRGVTADDFEVIESFYRERNAPVFLEISPLAPIELLSQLNDRGYKPIEYTSVLFRDLRQHLTLSFGSSPEIKIRAIDHSESETWALCSARGWSDDPDFFEMILGFGRTTAVSKRATCLLAEIDGKPVATGAVVIADEVALLAGASTIPEARCKGAQSALLQARLDYAGEQNCNLAMMCTLPGSPSQRNAQRNGFQIAYTRTKWKRDL